MNTNEAAQNLATPVTDESAPDTTPRPKARRGFAAMDPAKVREIASKGGKAAHEQGTAHQFTSEEARAAGKKGGVAPHVRRGRQAVPSTHPNDPPATAEAGGAE